MFMVSLFSHGSMLWWLSSHPATSRYTICWVSHFISCCAEHRFAEHCYAEHHYAEHHYAEHHYAEHHYAEHHYPEWSQISSLCWLSSCWMLWNCIQHCSISYRHKMPVSVGPSIMSICCFQGGSCVKTDCRDQCYITFYSRNLCWARVFVPGKPSQLSLIFVSKARAYPSEVTFRCSTLG